MVLCRDAATGRGRGQKKKTSFQNGASDNSHSHNFFFLGVGCVRVANLRRGEKKVSQGEKKKKIFHKSGERGTQ